MQETFRPETEPVGLSLEEAARRFVTEGPNELPHPDHRSAARVLIDVLHEPMFLFLVSAAGIYLLLGELKEALLLSVFATTSVLITIVQEMRSERVLEALRDLTSPRALVIRGRERHRIAGREVVRGDLLIVNEGDRVAADADFLSGGNLEVDESLLTGESVPVRKKAQQEGDQREDTTRLFSGTLVVRGQGLAEVFATGAKSEIGKIGASLAKIEAEPPRLKAETRRLVRLFGVIGSVLCVLAVLLQLSAGGKPLDAVLAGIALGMAMLPEEFPLVLTVFTVMGAWRISKARVLTRRAAAIEALGEATVLCTDKTGTLTENRMTIAELRLPTGERVEIEPVPSSGAPRHFHDLVVAGALASQPEPIDPMDRAFVTLAGLLKAGGAKLRQNGTLERSHGVTPGLLAVTNVWRDDATSGARTVAAKGAPEALATLCRLSAEKRTKLLAAAEEMAREGLRVLAVARAEAAEGGLPDTPHGFDFRLLGLVGLADPLRASVRDAVQECQSAGIRVVMITGDYPATAMAIAQAAGLQEGDVLTGEDVARLDQTQLREHVRHVSVFARITPSEKLRIVKALQANGEIVAMTGDGVNDAPSLKAAHIGIAMGGRGTDVAREASSLVLLDDDFGSIVHAIRLGRRIFDNLRKAMGFILAVHVPIAGLALLPLLFGLPIILTPVHIAFLELIIDPVCSIAFESEPEDEDVMARPPRATNSSLLPFDQLMWSLVQGGAVLVVAAAAFVFALRYGLPADEARSLAYGVLISAIIALVFANRTFDASISAALLKQNPVLWLVLSVAILLLSVTLLWPPAREMFRFGAFHGHDLAMAVAAGVALLVVLEGLKFLFLRYAAAKNASRMQT